MWEDVRNKSGGRWLFNLEKRDRKDLLDHCWLETVRRVHVHMHANVCMYIMYMYMYIYTCMYIFVCAAVTGHEMCVCTYIHVCNVLVHVNCVYIHMYLLT